MPGQAEDGGQRQPGNDHKVEKFCRGIRPQFGIRLQLIREAYAIKISEFKMVPFKMTVLKMAVLTLAVFKWQLSGESVENCSVQNDSC